MQGEEALYRMMLWPDGKFEVKYHDEVERADHIEKDSGDLLIEGIRRLEQWNELIGAVPALGRVYEADYQSLPDLLEQLPEEAGRVVRLFDGMRNLRDVIDDSPFDDVTTLQIVRRLFDEDVLEETENVEPESIRTTANLQAWLDGPKQKDEDGVPFRNVDETGEEGDPLMDTSPGVADAFNYEDEDSQAFEAETEPADDAHPPLATESKESEEASEAPASKERTRTSAGLGTVSRDGEATQWKVHWDEDDDAERQEGVVAEGSDADEGGPKSVEDIEQIEQRRREEEAKQIIRQSGQFDATIPRVNAVSRDDEDAVTEDLEETERARREAEAEQLAEQSHRDALAGDDSTPSVSTDDEANREGRRESTQELDAEPAAPTRGRTREPTPVAGPGATGGAPRQTSPGISTQDLDQPSEEENTAPADRTSPGIQITEPSAMPDSMTSDPDVDFEDETGEDKRDDDVVAEADEDEETGDDLRSSSEMRAASVEEADEVSREAGESMRRSAPFAAVTDEQLDAETDEDEEREAEASEEAGDVAPADESRERRVTQNISTPEVEEADETADEDEAVEDAEPDTVAGEEAQEAVEAEDAKSKDVEEEQEAADDIEAPEELTEDEEEDVAAEETVDESEEVAAEAAADGDELEADISEESSDKQDERAEELFEMAKGVDDDSHDSDEHFEDVDASAVEAFDEDVEIAVERSAKDRELVTAEYDLSKSSTASEATAEDQEDVDAEEEADEVAADAPEKEDEVEPNQKPRRTSPKLSLMRRRSKTRLRR